MVHEKPDSDDDGAVSVDEESDSDDEGVVSVHEKPDSDDDGAVSVDEESDSDDDGAKVVDEEADSDDEREVSVLEDSDSDDDGAVSVNEEPESEDEREVSIHEEPDLDDDGAVPVHEEPDSDDNDGVMGRPEEKVSNNHDLMFSDVSYESSEDEHNDEDDIEFDEFSEFLLENRVEVLNIMEKTRLPKTNNPFTSADNAKKLLKLLSFTQAVDALQIFCEKDTDVKKMQDGKGLLLQNARFERVILHFMPKFFALRVKKRFEVETVQVRESYPLQS